MLKLSKFKITNKGLYWGLIITFAVLYLCVGFVSTLHSITFFNLANNVGLAILLGLTYEVGQASVLFSILMTKNKDRFLPWALMFLLTALQVTANVYASFKFMVKSGSTDYVFWQKSILFGMQTSSPEMSQMIISWIAGALLPIVALGMTALVAENMKLMEEENEKRIEPDAQLQPETQTSEIEKTASEELTSIKSKYDELQKEIEKYKDSVKPTSEISENIDDDFDAVDLTNVEPDILPWAKKDDLDEEAEELTPIVKSDFVIDALDQIAKQKELDNQIVSEQFEKDLIIPEPPKKRGRPPKKQKEEVVEPKKEQEPLQKEDVQVPQKQKRFVNPLNQKDKLKPIKNLNEIIKPSKGEEVIQLMEDMDKNKDKESIIEDIKTDETSQESLLVPPELRTPYISNHGVEVLDGKAIPASEKIKKN